jgi:hypothetical protein
MKIAEIFIALLLSLRMLPAQSFPVKALTLSENILLFRTDLLGHLYTLTEDQRVQKWDKNGTLLFQYVNNRDGKLSHLDVRNPLQILLFYSDQQKIVSLDRTLSPLKEWQLKREDWGFVSAAAAGKNDRIWLFDQFNYQLGSVQSDGRVERQKTDLTLCCFQAPEIHFIAMNEQHLFLFDVQQGIIQCDLLGQFLQFIPIREWEEIVTFGNAIWLLKDNKIIEIRNNGQIKETLNPITAGEIIGFNDKEIFLKDGKSNKIVLIVKE